MGTKSKRSSGTQFNPRGITQGNTLVDPNTGLPIDVIEDSDGVRRLAVDATISLDSATINADISYLDGDSTAIGDPNTNATLKINPDGSIDSNVKVDALDGDNIAIKDSDGNELKINPTGSINVGGYSTPDIQNISIVAANTEYQFTIPATTKKFSIKARNNSKLQICFVSGQSGTNFKTIFPGSYYEETGLDMTTALTIYFRGNKAADVLEVSSWS